MPVCSITIRKQKDGTWIVTRPVREGKSVKRVMRGQDSVEWTLEQPDPDHPVSAHFQFTNPDEYPLFHGRRLTRDLTAAILRSPWTLKLTASACDDHRGKHRYAVWIADANHPEGGMYAVGSDGNPPPEVVMGP